MPFVVERQQISALEENIKAVTIRAGSWSSLTRHVAVLDPLCSVKLAPPQLTARPQVETEDIERFLFRAVDTRQENTATPDHRARLAIARCRRAPCDILC